MDINKVTLVGRLGRKPEEKQVSPEKKFCSFSVATNYSWRDFKTKEKKDKTEFHRVILWGKLADIAMQYLDKGSQVYIEGRIAYNEWTDKEGKKHENTDIIGSELVLLGSKKSDELVKEELNEQELIEES